MEITTSGMYLVGTVVGINVCVWIHIFMKILDTAPQPTKIIKELHYYK